MKRVIAFFLVLVITVCLFSACNTEKDPELQDDPVVKDFGKIFYVAVDGNDANEGTKESPLATLGGAVAKVREYKAANGLPEGGIKVEFAAGIYKVTQQTDLTAEDSGEAGKEIVYAAADGAEVIFDGGVSLNASDFKPANDDFKALLQTDEAKANVLEIDLISAGAGDLDEFKVPSMDMYGSGYAGTPWKNILYVNNETQTVARWPNSQYHSAVITSEWDGTRTLLSVPEEKALLWSEYGNIHSYGFGGFCWAPSYTDEVYVDVENSSVGIAAQYTYKENEKNKFFYLWNMPCELDEPGEYYIDSETDKLYYWPKDNIANSKITLGNMSEWIITLTDCSYISLEGLTFENLSFGCIRGTGSDISVSGCVFRCIYNYALSLSGNRYTIENNEFSHMGYGILGLSGGNSKTKENADSAVVNNVFHDYGEVYGSPVTAVDVRGCGFYVAYNEVYNCPSGAFTIQAANTILEYNEMYNVCTDVPDSGVVYSGCSFDTGSTVYRYNYIHDIVGTHGITGGNGLYIDDTECFKSVYSNIIVNVDGNGIALSGGKRLTAYNNILVNTGGISLDCRGATWYPTYTSYPDGQMWRSIPKSYLSDPIWKYAQPELFCILEMRTTEELTALKGIDGDIMDSPAPPSYIDIYNNIGYQCVSAAAERKSYIFNRNKYVVLNGIEGDRSPSSPKICGSAYMFGSLHDNLSYEDLSASDVFVDPENGNFFLKEDSRVYRDILNFEKWDYSLIGPQK